MGRPKIHENHREDLFKKVAEEMELPLDEIEKVMSWSYMKANKAMKDNKEVEISGLGKFIVSKAKAKRRIESLEDRLRTDLPEDKRIESEAELEYVKSKLENEQTERVSTTSTQGT